MLGSSTLASDAQACRGACQPAPAGDSACSIPPQTIPQECLDTIREWTPKLARELGVVGLINVQYCVQDNQASLAHTDKVPWLPDLTS